MDWTSIYQSYKGKWIVLDSDLMNVLLSGTSAKEVYEKALKKGEKKPTLFKVPKENIPYFGAY